MVETLTKPAAPPVTPATISTSVLETLASRVRAEGLYLLLLRPDGQLHWHDPSAGLFFHRYVLPLLQYPQAPQTSLCEHFQRLGGNSPIIFDQMLPGAILSVFSYVDRRQSLGLVVLAARSGDFEFGEDIQRVCGRLGLDGIWLSQQAQKLPACTPEAMQNHGRMLLNMLRDQMRLDSMDHELDSLSSQLSNSYEELSLIYQISGGMRINRQPADFFKQVCLDVTEVLGVRGMGFALHTDNLNFQEPVLYGHLSLPPGLVHRLTGQLMEELKQRKAPLLINHLRQHATFNWLGEYAGQLLAVPLQRDEKILGCLYGLDKRSGEFDSVDSKLLNSIANESSIYLENATLYDDVHGLVMSLMHSLTSAVDAKDAYTCGHSERVALVARLMAQEAGLDDYQIERTYMAGLLHDVGKIGVPEQVLQKTGRLTPEEYEVIKKHPRIGARILQNIKQIADIVPGVLYHHERYDGKGYPDGLAGEQIPLLGRIICLADCFDAMTSSRTYRKALPMEVALTEIRRCAGTQFDPVLSEALLRIIPSRFQQLQQEQQNRSREMIEMQQSLRNG